MTKFPLAGLFLACAVALTACSDLTHNDPISPDMRPTASLTEAGAETSTYLVRFRGAAVPSNFAARVAELGGEVVFAHARAGVAAVAGLTATGAETLSAVSGIAAVDEDAFTVQDAMIGDAALSDGPQSPTDPAAAAFFGRQWNMNAISAPAAWAAGTLGSPTVRVGILDTGIDYLHPDLIGLVDLDLSRSFLSAAENARVPAGAHLVADLNYHGTHVAATVASNGLAAAGVTSQVTLVGLKVCAPGTAANGFRGTCPTSGTLAAILYAADHGLDAINLSLGGAFRRANASAAGGFGPSFLATINQVMTYAASKGTVVVVSAGNSAFDLGTNRIPVGDEMVTIPGLYASYCDAPTAICISATGPTFARLVATPAHPTLREYVDIQNIDALAGYSNFGRGAIDLAAPGGNAIPVWAACSGFTLHPALAGCRGRFFDEATGAWSASVVGLAGTSMAAPHVTGLAALIAGRVGHNAALIAAGLRQSADDLGQPGVDPAYGHGRINVSRAMGH